MAATIDVLLPFYNAERYLEASLESLRQQTFEDFRVLMLDDGSTDGSAAIAHRFAAQDARFQLISLPRLELVEALNHGLGLVDAEYMARQDADDISLPGRFALQLDFLSRSQDICACSGSFFEMDADGVPNSANHYYGTRQPLLADPFAIPAQEPYLPHPFLMVRTVCLRGVGGYRHFRHSEDADLYWRLTLKGRLANIPDVLGIYRKHGESVSAHSQHNASVQSFSAQLSALSYRRLAALQPDFDITQDLARKINAQGSLTAMADVVPGLMPVERIYLLAAAYAKTFETIRHRGIRIERNLIEAAIRDYPVLRRAAGRRARRVRSRTWLGIRVYARQSGNMAGAVWLTARLLVASVRALA